MTVINLNQPVKVLAKFISGQLKPCKFAYKGRVYDVKDVSGFFQSKKGRLPVFFFSVKTKQSADMFELAFYFEDMNWYLKKIVIDDFI